jgi:hypothetical protein
MSTALRQGVQRLEVTTQVTLGVLALASGVYTYLGARQLLNGTATYVLFAALIYAVAVSVGIYAFWMFVMRLAPHARDHTSRALLTVTVLVGGVMIIAMSAWLNATALAGPAALEQHLANTLEGYTGDLDRAHARALAAQGLLPDIQMASMRFAKLADAEKTGSLTGTSGSGTVVQLLHQMSDQLNGLGQKVAESNDRVQALYDEGSKHLAAMRALVSDRGPINQRSDAFGAEATALIGTIASLQQTSVAPAVKRAATDLSSGFIAPTPDGRRGDLAQRQAQVVGRVQAAIAAQSTALSDAADKALDQPIVAPTRFQPISTAEAVLRYGGDFLPSWAGAISIDLLPAVLVLVLCVAHAGIRREGDVEEKEVANAKAYTVSDLIAVVRLVREVEQAQAQQGQYAQRAQAVTRSASVDGVTADSPKADSPKTDSPKVDSPRVDSPRVDAPKMVPTLATTDGDHDRPDAELEQNVMQLLTARTGKKE